MSKEPQTVPDLPRPAWPAVVSGVCVLTSIALYAWTVASPAMELPLAFFIAMPIISLAAVMLADRSRGPKLIRMLVGALGLVLTLLWVMQWINVGARS